MKFCTRELHYGLYHARVNARSLVTVGLRRAFKRSHKRDWQSSKKANNVVYCFYCFIVYCLKLKLQIISL